jgi:hypothetical protein
LESATETITILREEVVSDALRLRAVQMIDLAKIVKVKVTPPSPK